jgi:hypothetical protein
MEKDEVLPFGSRNLDNDKNLVFYFADKKTT